MAKKKPVEKEPVVQGDKDIAANGAMGNRVMVCISKTINFGNFQSLRLEAADCLVVQDGQSFKEVRAQLFEDLAVVLLEMIETAKEVFDSE